MEQLNSSMNKTKDLINEILKEYDFENRKPDYKANLHVIDLFLNRITKGKRS